MQIVACDALPAEVKILAQLVVEHWQDPILKLIHFIVHLILSGCLTQLQFLCDQHSSNPFSHWSNFLIEIRKQGILFGEGLFVEHVESVSVISGLISVRNVHHLNQSASIDTLVAVLKDWHVHGRVRLFEIFSHVLAPQHVDFDVLVVQSRDLAVELQGAAVGIQLEANNVYFVKFYPRDYSRSSVSLVLA